MGSGIAVVGAGVVGACAALRLAAAGERVTVLEALRPGAGASGRSFAWIGASPKGLWPYFAINAAGAAAHRRLAADLGRAEWLALPGSLAWHSDPARGPELAARVAELRDAGYPAELGERAAALAVEPVLRIGPEVEVVAHYPEEGWADVPALIAGALAAAREFGAEVRTAAEATRLETAGDAVLGVRLADGGRVAADRVVVCCGRHSGALLATAGVELPMLDPAEPGSPAVGLLARTAPGTAQLGRLLHADDLMARPCGEGSLLLHSDPHDARLAAGRGAAGPLAEDVLAEAGRHVRLAAAARVERAVVGLRALTADGLPAVGAVGAPRGLFVAATHSGVTLAPLLGELIAREVGAGTEEPLLADLRPTRFAPPPPAPSLEGARRCTIC